MNFDFSEEFDLEVNPISSSAKRKAHGGESSHSIRMDLGNIFPAKTRYFL